MRAITADVLQKETIEKQQKVINGILNSPIYKDSDHPVDKDLMTMTMEIMMKMKTVIAMIWSSKIWILRWKMRRMKMKT